MIQQVLYSRLHQFKNITMERVNDLTFKRDPTGPPPWPWTLNRCRRRQVHTKDGTVHRFVVLRRAAKGPSWLESRKPSKQRGDLRGAQEERRWGGTLNCPNLNRPTSQIIQPVAHRFHTLERYTFSIKAKAQMHILTAWPTR